MQAVNYKTEKPVFEFRVVLISSIDFLKKFTYPPSQTPTQMLKSGFSMFSTQEIGSSLVSFQIIFEFLQSELSRAGGDPEQGCKMGRKSNCVSCEIAIQLSKSNYDCEKLRLENHSKT